MKKFWILISVAFATNLLDKAESVKLELKTFDEIFGEGWWDNDKMSITKSTDRTPKLDKLNQIQLISLDKLNQIQLISLDKLNPIQLISLDKLNQIQLIRILLSQSLSTLLMPKMAKNFLLKMCKNMKAELKRAGFKNSYPTQLNETVAKELGLSDRTIYNWKQKLGQTGANNYAHNKQKEFLMKSYYKIKDKNPKKRDVDIAKILKIGSATLVRWKRQFKRQQFHPNPVEENAAANVRKLETRIREICEMANV
uniref:Transposase n=1 Tax=Globodera rostochiensis TaxID=31243 RepID=A0A914HR41_GLORO